MPIIDQPKKKSRWPKRIGWILLIYLAGGLFLSQLQDSLLFHPVKIPAYQSYGITAKHEDILIPLNETDSLSFLRFIPTRSPAKGVVLYFHGNKNNIAWYAPFVPAFTSQGYEVIMMDYPGYGKSRGELTEKKLYEWATIVYQIARKRYPANHIILYGKSMGTGIAAALAAKRDCRALILETPYYDFPSVLARYIPIYPLHRMLHYQLPIYQYLPNVTAPITLFHGTNDWIVSYSNTQQLSPLLKKTDRLITVEGGSHHNLFTYQIIRNTLDSILSQ